MNYKLNVVFLMKKFFCLFSLVILSHLAYPEEINIDAMALNDILKYKSWYMPSKEGIYIKFSDNNEYRLGYMAPGGQSFCWGNYEVIDTKVIVHYPFEILDWVLAYKTPQAAMNWFFGDQKTATFFYEDDYIDFDVRTRLANGDKILKNYSIQSPFGLVYNLDGIDVIKYDDLKDHVVVTDNLRMREKPSLDAAPKTLSIDMRWYDQEITGNITYKHAVHSFDAVTVKKDTIDGITAPWYRIHVILDEMDLEKVWVFGGYVKEISEEDYRNNARQYYENYHKSLIDSKIIRDRYAE